MRKVMYLLMISCLVKLFEPCGTEALFPQSSEADVCWTLKLESVNQEQA